MPEFLNRAKRAKYISEFLGTLFLVLFVKLAVPSGDPVTALAIGLGLGIMIFNAGHISGGMYNPSVTVAVITRDIPEFPRSDVAQIAMYFVSQYCGGIAGGLLAWMIGGKQAAAVYPTVYQDPAYYDDTTRVWQAFAAEFVFTFLLTSTVIYTATDKRTAGNQYFGLCIGLSLAVGVVCIGRISGCALNSAVWLGAVIPAAATGQIQHDLSDAWIYWAATLLGGFVAGYVFNQFNDQESLLLDHVYVDEKKERNDKERNGKTETAIDVELEALTHQNTTANAERAGIAIETVPDSEDEQI
eukprot:502657_1